MRQLWRGREEPPRLTRHWPPNWRVLWERAHPQRKSRKRAKAAPRPPRLRPRRGPRPRRPRPWRRFSRRRPRMIKRRRPNRMAGPTTPRATAAQDPPLPPPRQRWRSRGTPAAAQWPSSMRSFRKRPMSRPRRLPDSTYRHSRCRCCSRRPAAAQRREAVPQRATARSGRHGSPASSARTWRNGVGSFLSRRVGTLAGHE
mmetsp:Transcript_13045/g.33880  ORF Transcript_13045/g.33880 Transcript_13045/m.33880 type:complete len:200 (-) Transcript_13045:311-910(-)